MRMRNRGEIVFASYFQFKGEKNMIILFLASKRVSKHGFTFKLLICCVH